MASHTLWGFTYASWTVTGSESAKSLNASKLPDSVAAGARQQTLLLLRMQEDLLTMYLRVHFGFGFKFSQVLIVWPDMSDMLQVSDTVQRIRRVLFTIGQPEARSSPTPKCADKTHAAVGSSLSVAGSAKGHYNFRFSQILPTPKVVRIQNLSTPRS